MFSSKYGKCQSGSISATPSAEMNSVEMTFAIAVIPSSQVVSVGRPAQHPKLIGRRRSVPAQSRHSGLVVMHRHRLQHGRQRLRQTGGSCGGRRMCAHIARGLTAVLEHTDHQLCMPELMAAKLAATAPNGGSASADCTAVAYCSASSASLAVEAHLLRERLPRGRSRLA